MAGGERRGLRPALSLLLAAVLVLLAPADAAGAAAAAIPTGDAAQKKELMARVAIMKKAWAHMPKSEHKVPQLHQVTKPATPAPLDPDANGSGEVLPSVRQSSVDSLEKLDAGALDAITGQAVPPDQGQDAEYAASEPDAGAGGVGARARGAVSQGRFAWLMHRAALPRPAVRASAACAARFPCGCSVFARYGRPFSAAARPPSPQRPRRAPTPGNT